MDIGNFFIAILSPLCVMLVFSVIKKSSHSNKKMSDEKFIVFLPRMIAIIGLTDCLLAFLVFVIFIFFSQQELNWIFYLIFSTMFGMGAYLVIKALRFKVVIDKDIIEVTPILSKTYSFTFDDIVFVERQTKKNKTKSERIIVKTKSGKRLIVENAEVSYERFLRRIKLKVDSNLLKGFNNQGTNNEECTGDG